MANVEFNCPICEAELLAEIDADPEGASIVSIVAAAGDCEHAGLYGKLLEPAEVERLEQAAFEALEAQEDAARDRDTDNRIDAARGK